MKDKHPATSAAEPGDLTREELRRLARAERKAASPDRATALSGLREIQALGLQHGARIEGKGLAARLAETVALAAARGEEVRSENVRIASAVLDEHGARVVKGGLPLYRRELVARVRVPSRGGLQLAFERGDLDGGAVRAERLLEVGKAYRWAYETCAALTTPVRNLAPVSARSALRASAGPQEAVFAAGALLRIFRDGLSRREVDALDRVCGLDLTIRAAALALRADPRTLRRALLSGLARAEASRRAARDVTESVGQSQFRR